MSVDLKKYVPKFVSEINEFSALYDISSAEFNELYSEFEDIFAQTRINTATWGLSYWEYIYGLESNSNLPIDERRQALIARKIGQGTTTIQKIKEVARSYTGGEVDIIENPSDYSFIIKFISQKGIPQNIELFKSTIDSIKPAHLAYTLQYLYNTWGMVKKDNYTWEYYSNQTWDEIKSCD